MATMVTPDWHPIHGVVQMHLKRDKPYPGRTQKETAEYFAGWNSARSARHDEIARLGTYHRVLISQQFMAAQTRKWIAEVDEFAARVWLEDIETRWKAGEFKDTSDEDFEKFVWDSFVNDLVMGDDWNQTYVAMRRDAIVAGVIAAELPEDIEWLRQRAEELASLAQPYTAALSKINQ